MDKNYEVGDVIFFKYPLNDIISHATIALIEDKVDHREFGFWAIHGDEYYTVDERKCIPYSNPEVQAYIKKIKQARFDKSTEMYKAISSNGVPYDSIQEVSAAYMDYVLEHYDELDFLSNTNHEIFQ